MNQILSEAKTLGISPKAVAAFIWPAVAATGAAVVNWINTGSFDSTSVRLAVSGVIAGALASVGAYIGKPGIVHAPAQADAGAAQEGTPAAPSDALLADALGPPVQAMPDNPVPVQPTSTTAPTNAQQADQTVTNVPPQPGPTQ